MLKIAFKLMASKWFMLFMLNMLDFKNDENQINFPFMIYAEFKAF